MPEPRLATVTRRQGNNAALLDGTITPRGARFDFVDVPVLVHAFRRMVRELEFDVCEMAFTTYLAARDHGVPFTALPVFLVRAFHHAAIAVDTTRGIRHPKDLEGRAVGVSRGYTVTTGVWARGVLANEYGVDLDRVTWVLSGDEHVADFRAPGNVVSMPEGATLPQLLADGEIAATIGVHSEDPDVAPLIPDAGNAGLRALRRTGHYPINHLVVVRDTLLERHPALAGDVFGAFAAAKNDYVERLRAHAIGEPTPADHTYEQVMAATGADPLPYGIAPNRGAIDELLDHAVHQKILAERPDVDSLFARGTHDLTG